MAFSMAEQLKAALQILDEFFVIHRMEGNDEHEAEKALLTLHDFFDEEKEDGPQDHDHSE